MIGMSLLAPQRTTTINAAGTAAEAAASSVARGGRLKCNRGLGWMTLRECVERFQAGQDNPNDQNNPCARDLGCSAGRARVNMLQEDGEMGKSNYGACVECNRKGNRDSANRCYNVACKKARGKKPEPTPEAAPTPTPATADGLDLVDDLTPKESPILAPEEVAAMSTALSASGRDEFPEKAQESSENRVAAGQDVSTPVSAQDVTCHDPAAEAAALDAVMGLDAPAPVGGQDHFVEPNKMVTDFTRPFSFAGFEFDPGTPPPPPGLPIVRLTSSGNLSFSFAATQTHGLQRFQYVRVIPDKTGSALALIFLNEKQEGARKLGPEGKSALKISVETLCRTNPGLVGKALELRPMGQDGAFVAVAVEEAAA